MHFLQLADEPSVAGDVVGRNADRTKPLGQREVLFDTVRQSSKIKPPAQASSEETDSMFMR